jgi:sulfur relay (sulfurtransferase) DsrF/TusC family protein
MCKTDQNSHFSDLLDEIEMKDVLNILELLDLYTTAQRFIHSDLLKFSEFLVMDSAFT